MSLNRNQLAFVKSAEDIFGVGSILTRDGIDQVVEEAGISFPYWFTTKSEYRVGRGQYKLPDIGNKFKEKEVKTEVAEVALAAQVLEFRQPKLLDDSDIAQLNAMRFEIKMIVPSSINVSESGEENRKVYTSLSGAVENYLNLCLQS